MNRKYKKSALLSIGTLLILFNCALMNAALEEDRLTRSIIRQVESFSKKTKSLSALGRATFNQSTIILDLGESTLPVLLKTLKDTKINWKTRYWVTDSLGYVGNLKTLKPLLLVVKNEKEYKWTRLRALESIGEIVKKRGKEKGSKALRRLKQLKIDLKKLQEQVIDRNVKKRIFKTLRAVGVGK